MHRGNRRISVTDSETAVFSLVSPIEGTPQPHMVLELLTVVPRGLAGGNPLLSDATSGMAYVNLWIDGSPSIASNATPTIAQRTVVGFPQSLTAQGSIGSVVCSDHSPGKASSPWLNMRWLGPSP